MLFSTFFIHNFILCVVLGLSVSLLDGQFYQEMAPKPLVHQYEQSSMQATHAVVLQVIFINVEQICLVCSYNSTKVIQKKTKVEQRIKCDVTVF